VLIGRSLLFSQVVCVADAVAANDCVVLVEGESGTGKELLARRIHCRSRRSEGPFIPVNAASISESLFESQFFGHLRGAFTGATADTLGMVRAAEGGTLLLDEVGDLPLHLQPKLLRVIQEKEVTPVGAARAMPVDVRFIASTNRSLARAVVEGSFRSDLYHRLNIVRIYIPPLRNRPEDIDDLLAYYLSYYAEQYGMSRRHLSDSLRASLAAYPWPGNVRELCAYVERLYAANLPPMPPPPAIWDAKPADSRTGSAAGAEFEPDGEPRGYSLAEVEELAIRRALRLTGNNRSAAARLLDIHRATLLRKIRRLGLDL
jgi:two-component system response regulator HydG